MERITVTVCWVAPNGTADGLRGEDYSAVVVRATADLVASDPASLIFVNVTSEEA